MSYQENRSMEISEQQLGEPALEGGKPRWSLKSEQALGQGKMLLGALLPAVTAAAWAGGLLFCGSWGWDVPAAWGASEPEGGSGCSSRQAQRQL